MTLIAGSPMAGVRIPGTGGCRKVRVQKPGRGRSGGYRVITFYSGPEIPVFLLTVFVKSEKKNLTKGEQNALVMLTKHLVSRYSDER